MVVSVGTMVSEVDLFWYSFKQSRVGQYHGFLGRKPVCISLLNTYSAPIQGFPPLPSPHALIPTHSPQTPLTLVQEFHHSDLLPDSLNSSHRTQKPFQFKPSHPKPYPQPHSQYPLPLPLLPTYLQQPFPRAYTVLPYLPPPSPLLPPLSQPSSPDCGSTKPLWSLSLNADPSTPPLIPASKKIPDSTAPCKRVGWREKRIVAADSPRLALAILGKPHLRLRAKLVEARYFSGSNMKGALLGSETGGGVLEGEGR